MPPPILEIKERLVRVVDENGTVKDMGVAAEAISLLEKISVTKEELEMTRLGRYVNIVRKAAKNNPPLAKRARNLVKTWQMIAQETPQRQPLPQQRLRPETPNSLGSSPSPPDPYTPPTPAQVFAPQTPHSGTPTTGSASKRSKKHKEVSKSSRANKKKLKSPDKANGGTDGVVSQSSEVKKSPEGQHLMSVGTNGLKLTFKMTPGAQTDANDDEEVDVVVSDGSQQWRRDMLERTDESKRAATPTQKDGRKKHKKKKQHKSPHKTPPSLPPTQNFTSERVPSQEDLYNNNKNQPKLIHASQSTPNFTVMKHPVKIKSPDKPLKNHIISTTKSYNDLQKLTTDNTNVNLKRKREHSLVNDVSPDSPSVSCGERPRGTKERRLTFDPVTGQLQQRQSTEKQDHNSTKEMKTIPDKVQAIKPHPESAKTIPKNISAKQKVAVVKEIKTVHKEQKIPQEMVTEMTGDSRMLDAAELPTGLVPSVSITNDSGASAENCSGKCSTDFYEMRRQFRKRKTRRKDDIVDLPSLFPISNLVTMVSSESDEGSDSENTFCSSFAPDVKAQFSGGNSSTKHTACERPGVNGCRGNNGNWYDWLETFCVQNHDKKTTQPLPNEEEIVPLHVLPYVELD